MDLKGPLRFIKLTSVLHDSITSANVVQQKIAERMNDLVTQ